MTTTRTSPGGVGIAPLTPPPPPVRPDGPRAGGVVLVAAHGGCGATTLTAHASSHTLVREADLRAAMSAAVDEDVLCVVAAAATADGTARAARTLHHLERAGFPAHRLRLALVRDGRGPMPVAARARLRLLSAVVGAVDVVPHVQRWRYESGTRKSLSRRYERAVERFVEDLIDAPAPHRALPLDDVHFYDDDLRELPDDQGPGLDDRYAASPAWGMSTALPAPREDHA